MSQFDWGTLNPLTESGTQLMLDLNAFRSAVESTHSGTVRPTYLGAGGTWINNASTPWVVYSCTTSNSAGDIVIGYLDPTTLVYIGVTTEGLLSKSVAGASNVTLTPIESINSIFEFTGALTASIAVIVPDTKKRYQVENLTTGAYTLTIKTAGGSGISVPQGTTASLYCNGINIEDSNSSKQGISGQISGFRNKIINGDMQVSQVNGGTAVTPTGLVYPIDQWQFVPSVSSKLTFQQVVDAPAGFKYSTKITVATQYSPSAADYLIFQQPIEGQNVVDLGFGTSTPATIAVSMWIKGSIAGTYAFSITNQGVRAYVGTVSVTASWTKQTVVLVCDNIGVWTTDNTQSATIRFDLGCGTNYSQAANTWVAGTIGNCRTSTSTIFCNQVAGSTLNITGVQLEQVSPGATQGTAFEHVSYADQLRGCQRYLPYFNAGAYSMVLQATGATAAYGGPITFPVQTRVGVTGIVSVGVATASAANGVSAGGTLGVYISSNTNPTISMTGCTGLVAGNASAVFGMSAVYFTGSQM
jgi:hypothetical protein